MGYLSCSATRNNLVWSPGNFSHTGVLSVALGSCLSSKTISSRYCRGYVFLALPWSSLSSVIFADESSLSITRSKEFFGAASVSLRRKAVHFTTDDAKRSLSEKKKVMSTGFPPTMQSSSSWLASMTLHCCKEGLRVSGQRKDALFARALALAYLESLGGVVSPDCNELIVGVQFSELTSWSSSTGSCDSNTGRDFAQMRLRLILWRRCGVR
jgi:hypothetical protein